MAIFAKVENGIVVNVIVIDDSQENVQAFINDDLGLEGLWRLTDTVCGVGYSFDEENDSYIPPKPFPSWELDENLFWQPPIPMPQSDEYGYSWNEETVSWEEVVINDSP
jgi:hypothetical protein